jgi:hypothetical protein
MKKPPSPPSTESGVAPTAPLSLPVQEQRRLEAALETARENVQPTVKRLMESEAVSNELLSMRLERSHVHDHGDL